MLYHVKVARTPEEQYQGLSDVMQLLPHQGMLFVFDELSTSAFCNRRTFVPLDVLFLDDEGYIQEIGSLRSCLEHREQRRVEQPSKRSARGSGCSTGAASDEIRPKYAYRAVLEVPRGTAARHGLQIGDRLGLWLTAPSDHGMWAQVLRRSPVSSRLLRAPALRAM